MLNNNEFLSQKELDKLLKNTKSSEEENLDQILDIMGEIANITMGSGTTTLSTLLRRKIEIEYPETSIVKFKNIKTNFKGEHVVATVEYKKGLYGMNTLVLPANLTNIIANLMLGKDPYETMEEIDEISLSAVAEAMNQMMGTAATALSDFLKTTIEISPPKTELLDFSDPNVEFPPIETDKEAYVISIKYKVKISGIAETVFWQFIPLKFANTIKMRMEEIYGISKVGKKKMPEKKESVINTNYFNDEKGKATSVIKEGTVKVRPVEFGEFEKKEQPLPEGVDFSKLELLMDVPLEIKVELGSVRMTLREILDLHEGSLIQLNKLAGEPLDIYANDRLIARGEVVVIDENFGIRVTEIVSLRERIKTLK
ncbi:MAG TPA: flagellar motor switch phosphatase FliY [Defluviitoga sp.]|nr:flagellar motor switch phosphatase FliY [Defluviitoga sp.]HPZ28280.1 flagellar motor switch phosphatase FliY [Defluviitoga sp.]HQD62170.1 flagellar motor switch phosphatase FliY [Defluviitoga sp.]